MPVITISRQFGAAGVPVGRALAEKLGADFFDRALVAQVAVRSGIPGTELETYDERLPSFWQRVAAALTTSSPEVAMPASSYADELTQLTTHDRLVAITRSVIEEAAERGNVVIVGRGAAFILGRKEGTLHVQLHAALDARIRYLMSRVEEIPGETLPDGSSLRQLCRSIDAARADYIRGIFNADWLDARHYDLSVDTGRLGVDGTVQVIEAAVEASEA
ncbi:MAG: AAA family ATPase [Candidatus Limnocylindrales bacterium]